MIYSAYFIVNTTYWSNYFIVNTTCRKIYKVVLSINIKKMKDTSIKISKENVKKLSLIKYRKDLKSINDVLDELLKLNKEVKKNDNKNTGANR